MSPYSNWQSCLTLLAVLRARLSRDCD